MTDAERMLWNKLKAKQLRVKFRRQHTIGKYIVDFVCLEKRLVIEIDGGQHAGLDKDVSRDKWLEEQGYKVVRLWNNDVLANLEGVCEKIRKYI